jgi:hypothetical protein
LGYFKTFFFIHKFDKKVLLYFYFVCGHKSGNQYTSHSESTQNRAQKLAMDSGLSKLELEYIQAHKDGLNAKLNSFPIHNIFGLGNVFVTVAIMFA